MRISFCCSDTRPEAWLEGLRIGLPGAQVERWEPGQPPADYAVVWAPPQQFFDEQPALKGIFNIGAGVDALIRLRLPEGVPLVRLDDAGMSVQMAEYVAHAVIGHFRDFDAYKADQEQGKWAYRKPGLRRDFPVGVMGLGVLGERVSRLLASLDFPVMGWSRSPKSIPGVQCFSGDVDDSNGSGKGNGFDAFLRASRFLICLLPLTPDTVNIMNKRNLSKLLPGAYVINVARGAQLVDDDLLALLETGHIAGATLDVFRTEPLPAAHPFWAHPRITVTPHTSARTQRDESIAQIASKIRALAGGAELSTIAGVVDLKKGY